MADWDDLIAQAKENGYSNVVLPTDEYEAEVKSATFQQKSGKKDNIWVKWKVISGPFADEVVSDNIYIDLSNPKLMGVVLSKLNGAGITNEFLSGLKNRFGSLDESTKADHFKAIAGQLTGNQAVLKVTATEYQGKPKNEVFPQGPLNVSTVTDHAATAETTVTNRYASDPVSTDMPI